MSSFHSILAAVPGLSPHDRRRMLQAAAAKKGDEKVVPIPVHLVRAVLNKSTTIGHLHITHVEAIITALQEARLVADDES